MKYAKPLLGILFLTLSSLISAGDGGIAYSENLPRQVGTFVGCGAVASECEAIAKHFGFQHYTSRYDRSLCGGHPVACFGY